MIWQAGVALVLLGYVIAYWRRGITHPVPLLLAYWIVMLPAKYFLFVALDLPFTENYPRSVVDYGSFCLFFFLAFTVAFHWLFRRTGTGFALVEAVPRVDFSLVTMLLIGTLLGFAVVTGGPATLVDSLKLRMIAELGPGAYFTVVILFSMTAATIALSARRNWLGLAAFLTVTLGYFLLMARSGIVLILATTILSYQCMVRRYVPLRWLLIGAAIFIPLSLVQGVLRSSGGYTVTSVSHALVLANSANASRFAVEAFGSRVSQLETFSAFADRLRTGIIKVDPLSPIYAFDQVLPRSVWPDKPELFSDAMTANIAPRVHELHVVLNFIGPAEFMYTFGEILGIVLAAALFGYIFAIIDEYYIFAKDRPGAFMFVALTVIPFIGQGSQNGFFYGGAALQVFAYGIMLCLFFRLRIHARVPSGSSEATFGVT